MGCNGADELHADSREALLRIAALLRDGWSGTLVVRCQTGVVRRIEEQKTWSPQRDRQGAA